MLVFAGRHAAAVGRPNEAETLQTGPWSSRPAAATTPAASPPEPAGEAKTNETLRSIVQSILK